MSIRRSAWLAAVALIAVGLWTAVGWTDPSAQTQTLIAAHHQAAVEAREKVVFHEKMEKEFVSGRGGSKIDMVGHCRYWADYYRKLAAQEEKAAKELE